MQQYNPQKPLREASKFGVLLIMMVIYINLKYIQVKTKLTILLMRINLLAYEDQLFSE